jgi:hypothetical protein
LIWQDANGNWSNYGPLPNPKGTPYAAVTAGTNGGGLLQVVCIGQNDGQPYLIWQDTNGNWTNYGPLPNPAGTAYASVTAGTNGGGLLQVVCIGKNDGQAYLIWQAANGSWANYGLMPNPNRTNNAPTPFGSVVTGVGNGGQLQVICSGADDGHPYLIWQDQNGNWHGYDGYLA